MKANERLCGNCDGDGYVRDVDERVPCPACGGRGKIVEKESPMPNCTCGSPLREGESECDKCILKRYLAADVVAHYKSIHAWIQGRFLYKASDVAKALRRAEKAGTSTEGDK